MRISDTCRYCGLVNGYEVTATVCRDLAACNARIALRQAVPLTAEEHRAALTRALTAQAWADMCLVAASHPDRGVFAPWHTCEGTCDCEPDDDGGTCCKPFLAAKAPADLAAELMGDRVAESDRMGT